MSKQHRPKRIMISAGEASGDLHAAKLVTALRQREADIDIMAMGAEHLRNSGADILVDCRDIAVVGLVEVLTHWSQIQAALNTLKAALQQQKPDLLILVDYVEFNLKLAAEAKKLGIKVLFYVSPQVWAWRQGRVPKIGKVIDMMAVIFPFETDIYEQHGVPVRYVGHPLASEVAATQSREDFRRAEKLDEQQPLVAILPGSRRSEVTRILPTMLESAERVAETLPGAQFLVAVADTLDSDWVQGFVDQHPQLAITVIKGNTYNAINAADSALVASGTATLETALLGTPMSIVYRVNGMTYQILKRMIKVDFIGLANIVAGRQVAPEFVQNYANPWLIALEVVKQITSPGYRDGIAAGLDTVAEKLGEGGGTQKLAELVFELLEEK